MHNLGLGGLEFNPTHTIDEHRPAGFKLPNVIEDVTSSAQTSINLNGTTISDKKENTTSPTTIYEYQSKDAIADHHHDSIADNLFRTLHDPKHRHPRHHGSI